MENAPESRNEQRLLDLSLVVLVAYNLIYLVDIVLPEGAVQHLSAEVMAFIDARRGWVTLFEAVAGVALFLDLIVRFDQYPEKPRRYRILGVAIVGAGLIFKGFTFYLNSSYLE